MNSKDLLMLAGLLFIFYHIFIIKRENLQNTREIKDCEQRAINEAYLEYVFSRPNRR